MVLFRITENEPSKMHNMRPYVYSRPWVAVSYLLCVGDSYIRGDRGAVSIISWF